MIWFQPHMNGVCYLFVLIYRAQEGKFVLNHLKCLLIDKERVS
jgi:hypothetical protein